MKMTLECERGVSRLERGLVTALCAGCGKPGHAGLLVLRLLAGLVITIVAAKADTVDAIWHAPTEVPITAGEYTATGHTVTLTLNHAPATGANLTVIRNTGLDFIHGQFINLTQGQEVALGYAGLTYSFVANYYGGTGNDLVLVWAHNRALAWGANSFGQVGTNSGTRVLYPIPVSRAGALSGKTLLAVAAGNVHSLAACSDGTVVAWGYNEDGQLGDNTTTGSIMPVRVMSTVGSALFGKTVVAVAAGAYHSLALCADGTVVTWGRNDRGQLGDNSTTARHAAVAVNTTPGLSALGGKTVVAIAAGYRHSLALCSDGTVAAWGDNAFGQLGDNTTNQRLVPVAVNKASGISALYDKTARGIAAGYAHSLALRMDGTVVSWGSNTYGQLGDNTLIQRLAPAAVSTDGGISALTGKTVNAIASGAYHSLALCADGAVAAWGNNSYGQIGDGSTTQRKAPTAVNLLAAGPALTGKTPEGIATGALHNLLACTDGTVATWGDNGYGQLGDNSVTQRNAPVVVDTGVLAAGERFVAGTTAGSYALHCIGLSALPPAPLISVELPADFSLTDGGATADFGLVAVSSPKSLTFTVRNTGTEDLTGLAITKSGAHQADFTVGPLGTVSLPPRATTTFTIIFSPGTTTSRTAAIKIASNVTGDANPFDIILVGTGSLGRAFTGSCSAGPTWKRPIANGSNPPTSLSSSATAVPYDVIGFAVNIGGTYVLRSTGTAPPDWDNYCFLYAASFAAQTPLSGILIGNDDFPDPGTSGFSYQLAAGTHYYFVTSGYSNTDSGDYTLEVLGPSVATPLAPDVAVEQPAGTVLADGVSSVDCGNIPIGSSGIPVTFTVRNTSDSTVNNLSVTIDGINAAEYMVGSLGATTLTPGDSTTFTTVLTPTSWGLRNATMHLASNVSGTKNPFDVNLHGCGIGTGRLAVNYTNAVEVPMRSNGYTAAGSTVDFALSYAPAPGTTLMVVENAGIDFIQGNFVNLAHGQAVALSYNGKTYQFVANYFGGSGNDLVLEWAGTRVFAWGLNANGEVGDGTMDDRPVAVAVSATGLGVLHGRTVVAVATGAYHSLALCSDGTVATWGFNGNGQLGDNSTVYRTVPVAVCTEEGVSAIHGKTVIAVAAGYAHSLALCSDGTVAAWGANSYGYLGDNTGTQRLVPVAVNTSSGVSALHGKSVAAIAAGYLHSLALCSDGTVVAWGRNTQSQLGTDCGEQSLAPVAVDMTPGVSALAGKRVVAIAAGAAHNLALCADGTLAAWGFNSNGQLGDNTTTDRAVPSVVCTASGVSGLYGKMVTAISAGYGHSMALCSDGAVATWGSNACGELGDNTAQDRNLPGLVNQTPGLSALAAKPVACIAAGDSQSYALCTDGTLAAWGDNYLGRLGDGTMLDRSVPVTVSRSSLSPDEAFVRLASGEDGKHGLVLAASSAQYSPPSCAAIPVSELIGTGARLNGVVNAHGNDTTVVFEYGSDGVTFPHQIVTSGVVTGSGDSAVNSTVSGLQKATTYYYRLTAINRGGITVSDTTSFVTFTDPTVTVGGAAALTTTSVQVFGSVNARGADTQVVVDYGTDPGNLQFSAQATPLVVTGYGDIAVSVILTNLPQGNTYYYRVRATSLGGVGVSVSNSFQLASLSGLNRHDPSDAPDARGYVFVTLNPPGIVSGWRFVGEQQWRASGVPAVVLTSGNRDIEYRPVPGFIQPLRETVAVVSGAPATLVSADYYEAAGSGATGALSVILKPTALADASVAAVQRAQWRLLGETDTQWRDAAATLSGLPSGDYLVECKPLIGQTTPSPTSVPVVAGQTRVATVTYFQAGATTGTLPAVLSFDAVTGSPTMPYAYVGQIRSDSGSSSGFVVKPRVVATAAHVVFDDGTLAYVTGLQWIFQRDSASYEPVPQIPRGFYQFDGYAAQRAADASPGVSSPSAQNLDTAAIYFLEDAARGGYGGYLASDLDNNEYLVSAKLKLLAGYPVDGIAALKQGRMHATAPTDVSFAKAYGHTYTTSDIRSAGGASGGPLCVQHANGNFYPAAIYLGGSSQTVVRSIDSQIIDLFNRAEVSGNGGTNNTGGGITHTSVSTLGDTPRSGIIRVNIEPAAARIGGGGWKLKAETPAISYRQSGSQKSGLSPGTYILQLTPVTGFQSPTEPPVEVVGDQLTEVTFTYAPDLPSLESWRLANFGTSSNTSDAADSADPDHDGQSNLSEYAAGTDPNKAADVFKVLISQKAGTNLTLTVAGKAGRTYSLQRSAELANGTWITLTILGPLFADGPVLLTDEAAPASKAFYRVQVTVP